MAEENLTDQKTDDDTWTPGSNVPTGPEATEDGLNLTDAELLDPEDQVLADLEKEGAAEGIDIQGGEVKPGPDPEPKPAPDPAPVSDQPPSVADMAPPATPAAPAAPEGGDQAPPNTVPVAAFTRLRGDLSKSLRENAALQGQVAAYRDMAKSDVGQEPEPVVDPELVKLEDLKEQKRKAFQEYEDSEIDAAEYNARAETLDEEIFDVRSNLRDAQAGVTQAPVEQPMDSGVESNKIQLRNKYPVAKALGDEGMQPYVKRVVDHYSQHNVTLDPKNPLHIMEVHNRAFKLADDTFRLALGAPAQPTDAPVGDPPNPATAGGNDQENLAQPGSDTELSPEAQARKEKLALAGGQPPNISDQGGAPNTGVLTDEQVELQIDSMTEEERADFLSANPALTQRILGHSSSPSGVAST